MRKRLVGLRLINSKGHRLGCAEDHKDYDLQLLCLVHCTERKEDRECTRKGGDPSLIDPTGFYSVDQDPA